MRIELRDDQWADLRDQITHGQDKLIKAAVRKSRHLGDDELDEFETTVVRTYVRDWYVKDIEGNPIPVTDSNALDRAPDDIIDQLLGEANALYKAGDRPPSAYSALIGRLILGQAVYESEINALPDPAKFRDAVFLAKNGRWSPRDLDEMDRELLVLVKRLQTPVKKRG